MSILELWVFFTLIPGLNAMAFGVAFLGSGLSIASCLLSIGAETDEQRKRSEKDYYPDALQDRLARYAPKALLVSSCVAVAATLIAVVLPSESELMRIIGGHVVTNIEGVEKLPPNLIDAANAFLERIQREE